MRTVNHEPTEEQKKRWQHQPDDSWKCSCGTDIMAVSQTRSVWLSDGPGPCAGTGEVEIHVIPYCPKCDRRPESNGPPTYETIAENTVKNLF